MLQDILSKETTPAIFKVFVIHSLTDAYIIFKKRREIKKKNE